MFIWFVWNKFRITEVCRIVSCRHLFWSDKTFVLLVYCDIWHFELSVNCNYAAEPPKRQICYWHLQKCETTLPTQFFPALLPSHVWYQTLVTGFRFCYICTRLPFIRLPPLASYSTLWETFLLSLNPQIGRPYEHSFLTPCTKAPGEPAHSQAAAGKEQIGRRRWRKVCTLSPMYCPLK